MKNTKTTTKTINLGYHAMEDWTGREDSTFGNWMHENGEYDKEIKDNPPDQIVLGGNKTFIVTIDYPLEKPFAGSFKTPAKGMTRKQLFSQITKFYKQIYREEEQDDGDPGMIPGMYNRADSNGRYGIWGHCLGDLILHTAHVKGNKITVGVDS